MNTYPILLEYPERPHRGTRPCDLFRGRYIQGANIRQDRVEITSAFAGSQADEAYPQWVHRQEAVFVSDRDGTPTIYRQRKRNEPKTWFQAKGLTAMALDRATKSVFYIMDGKLFHGDENSKRQLDLGRFVPQLLAADPTASAVWVAATTGGTQPGRLLRVDAASGRVSGESYFDVPIGSLAVSPDGSTVAYTLPRGLHDELYCQKGHERWSVICTDSETEGHYGGRYVVSSFSPDGSRVLYSISHAASSVLKVVRTDGSSRSYPVMPGYLSAVFPPA